MTIKGRLPDMGQVMALLRQGDPGAATALIQNRLMGRDSGTVPVPAPKPTPKPARRARPAVLPRIRPRKTPAGDDAGMARHRYTGAMGARDYLMFTPANPAARPAVVVMLHGCTQSAADFARGTGMNAAAGAAGWHVIYPEQPSEANAMRCWNWFEPAHQSKGAGEPAILMGLIDDALTRAGLQGADVCVAGLSAGGAMAAILADTYPERLVAVGIHSGLPARAAGSMPAAFQAMKSGARPGRDHGVPMIVFHGEADETVTPANGRAVAAHVGATQDRTGRSPGGLNWRCGVGEGGEYWRIEGMGHAWSGGQPTGSYTDPRGPDASAELVRFFQDRRA